MADSSRNILMKAFFDTNVYVNSFFKKILPHEEFVRFFDLYDIVICPIVRHELLLGTIHEKTRKELDSFFEKCPVLEAPTKEVWEDATHLMKKLKWKENRQQNDILIALTAQSEEAAVITYDRHFEDMKKWISFELVLLREPR